MAYPDFIEDREGLERWRASALEGSGHDMAHANKNTLYRFVQTIDNLEARATKAEAERDEIVAVVGETVDFYRDEQKQAEQYGIPARTSEMALARVQAAENVQRRVTESLAALSNQKTGEA